MIYQKNEMTWRDAYNPLRGLTMSHLAWLLEEGERGAYADLQWLYRMVEKRDAILRAGKRLRMAALSNFDWEVRTITPGKNFDEKLADEQAACLREVYEGIDNLKEAVSHLALAEFRGFAHLEKHVEEVAGERVCRHLEPVPQWLWVRKGIYGEWEYNGDAKSGVTNGERIEASEWVIREKEDAIDEIGVISFMRRNLSQKDWDGFVETYGIPPLFAEMPANIPADKVEEYQALAEAVIGDARGALPNGARITTVDTGGGNGGAPFRDHIEYQDSLVVMAMTSGRLKMLNDATGLGGGQANVHEETFTKLARCEAMEISEVFQKQFDELVLGEKFPGKKVCAYWELTEKSVVDVEKAIEQVSRLKQAGFAVDVGQVAEMTGYQLQENQSELEK